MVEQFPIPCRQVNRMAKETGIGGIGIAIARLVADRNRHAELAKRNQLEALRYKDIAWRLAKHFTPEYLRRMDTIGHRFVIGEKGQLLGITSGMVSLRGEE